MSLIVTVVREYGEVGTALVASEEEEARAWFVKELYMVEDGELPAGAPAPDIDSLSSYARRLGWEIDVNPA
ncbi:MAG: hypothetical protein Q4C81_04150 [Kocuria sp.]|nr:hypothetical protein [Kocuria sp.]